MLVGGGNAVHLVTSPGAVSSLVGVDVPVVEWMTTDDRVWSAGRPSRPPSSPCSPPPPRKTSTPAVCCVQAAGTASRAGAWGGSTSAGLTTSARLMRRSASFDTIAGFYLAGRWPCRDPSTLMASVINGPPIVLSVDKSTQVCCCCCQLNLGTSVFGYRSS